MAKTLIRSFTVETIRELVQAAGFRAEIASDAAASGGPVIRSASSGLAFEIRLLNPLQIDPKNFADLTFTAGLQLQSALALEVVNRWNASKRFSRLYITQGHLIIAMDVVLQGGVPSEHLRAQIEIWDRLLQELLVYLRNAASQEAPKKLAPKQGGAVVKAATPEIENTDMRKPTLGNGHAQSTSTNVNVNVTGAQAIETTSDTEDRAAPEQP